jgi:acyl-coenzyme A thioesterase PaaI-like protein
MLDELPFRLDIGFDRLYGLQVTEVGEGTMRATVAVRDAIAESLATTGTALAVLSDGKTAMGLSNQTSFLRPVTEGSIHAAAQARHRGRTTWVWEVEAVDDAQRLCALSRITVAVREASAPG